jgi:hypothetical protein
MLCLYNQCSLCSALHKVDCRSLMRLRGEDIEGGVPLSVVNEPNPSRVAYLGSAHVPHIVHSCNWVLCNKVVYVSMQRRGSKETMQSYHLYTAELLSARLSIAYCMLVWRCNCCNWKYACMGWPVATCMNPNTLP